MKAHRLAAAGLLLAVLAEACSVGLLGLSGWFIAAAAVAGGSAYSAFSYLAPSGGVRAFAVSRIAMGYANRVVLHAAALRRIGATRLAVYDRAAGSEVTSWSGQTLDRVMADADTTGMALIQVHTPVVVGAVMTAGGCVAIVLAGYPAVALALVVAVIVCAVFAATARRTEDTSRGLVRTELVAAVEAWPEMASLGAADQLADRTLQRLAAFEDQRNRQAATTARAIGGTRVVTAVAQLLTVLLTARAGATASRLVFVALLAAGVLANAERLVPAASAWARARLADARLASVGGDDPRRPRPACTFRASYDGHSLAVSGYQLSETPTRPAHELGFTAAAGETVVVTGPSGSGKTLLLGAITTALRDQPATTAAVLAEDYLFTGTVAGNIRLADPAATETGITELVTAMGLHRAGLTPRTRVGVGGRTLSGGEQRRLHLARALAVHPDVLLVDEPTTGLDSRIAAAVLTEIRRHLPHAVLLLAMHEAPADPLTVGAGWITVSLG
ncbi:ATP-binding cassette domain-containing protein [Kribbella speibonae]|uniref:ATP-binding cassette domain-containing protein n=1 Tax=Kribbella speibonae TaxID=1572660 RepID=A0ABY1ZT83_9ACTN|nr:ATP-binding cassette domain-containing protein [Kribbella speibonae]TCC16860.1 ATP-binding cassette domain-containing protein [Kribbella speibonae]